VRLRDLEVHRRSLEQVYLDLTGGLERSGV
jgi:hypothetical protein